MRWAYIIAGAIAAGGGATTAALTAGTVPAIIVGVTAAAAWVAGWLHPAPGASKGGAT